MTWYTGRESDYRHDYLRGPDECFYCYKKLGAPRITWGGAGGGEIRVAISLHPECVLRLCQHMMKDALAAEKKAAHPRYVLDVEQDEECGRLRKEVQRLREILLCDKPYPAGVAQKLDEVSRAMGEQGTALDRAETLATVARKTYEAALLAAGGRHDDVSRRALTLLMEAEGVRDSLRRKGRRA